MGAILQGGGHLPSVLPEGLVAVEFVAVEFVVVEFVVAAAAAAVIEGSFEAHCYLMPSLRVLYKIILIFLKLLFLRKYL